MQVTVPGPAGSTEITSEPGRPVLLLGANGSGKTRLGVYIHQHPETGITHRIAAQRSLELPDEVLSETFDKAIEALIPDNKQGRGKPRAPQMMAYDFDELVMALFAEQARTLERAHASASGRKSTPRSNTRIDQLRAMWSALLPHRTLLFAENSVRAISTDSDAVPYGASHMSDGERVIFYMLAQSLLVPEGATLIVDEPESHINRALVIRLWDLIEATRDDCAFVYITHDTDFSASRRTAERYVVLDYTPGVHEPAPGRRKGMIEIKPELWSLEKLPEGDIPDDILTLIAGSRQPVLFVEGEKGSLDPSIYRAVYDGFTIIPAGSCASVMKLVRSFQAQPALHWRSCAGLVDRDEREPNADGRIGDSLFALPVSELENVFLLPEVFLAVAGLLNFSSDDAQARLSRLGDKVFAWAAGTSGQVSLKHARAAVHEAGRSFGFEADTIDDLVAAYRDAFEQNQPEPTYLKFKARFDRAVYERDLACVLELYGNKGLLDHAAKVLDLPGRKALEALIARSLLRPEGASLLRVLRRTLPQISVA